MACSSVRYNASRDKNPLTHYVVVRADLPKGLQAAQIVHAAGESSPGLLPPSTYAVVLAARDEAQLRAVVRTLVEHGVPHVPVYEIDAPYNGELMAVGVVPARKDVLRKHLSCLPLLR